MMFDTIEPYISNAVAAIVGGLVGWFPNRKRDHINNQQSIVDLYQESLTDLKIRYEEKNQDIKNNYEDKFKHLEERFAERLDVFSAKIGILEKNVREWKNKYFVLKTEFDKYKKEHP